MITVKVAVGHRPRPHLVVTTVVDIVVGVAVAVVSPGPLWYWTPSQTQKSLSALSALLSSSSFAVDLLAVAADAPPPFHVVALRTHRDQPVTRARDACTRARDRRCQQASKTRDAGESVPDMVWSFTAVVGANFEACWTAGKTCL